jgi:hypothetical protein
MQGKMKNYLTLVKFVGRPIVSKLAGFDFLRYNVNLKASGSLPKIAY